jgi:hypothetical protein
MADIERVQSRSRIDLGNYFDAQTKVFAFVAQFRHMKTEVDVKTGKSTERPTLNTIAQGGELAGVMTVIPQESLKQALPMARAKAEKVLLQKGINMADCNESQYQVEQNGSLFVRVSWLTSGADITRL